MWRGEHEEQERQKLGRVPRGQLQESSLMAESQERLRNRPYIGDRDGGMIMDFDGRVR